MRILMLLVAVLFMAVAAPAAAANDVGPNTTEAYRRCDRAAGAEVEKARCLDAELIRQKGHLEAAYRLRTNGEEDSGAALIAKAQRAWLAFRDADCKAQQVRGGSAAAQSWLTCMVRLTANRATEMETYGAW